jgi:hypothetical protein
LGEFSRPFLERIVGRSHIHTLSCGMEIAQSAWALPYARRFASIAEPVGLFDFHTELGE